MKRKIGEDEDDVLRPPSMSVEGSHVKGGKSLIRVNLKEVRTRNVKYFQSTAADSIETKGFRPL